MRSDADIAKLYAGRVKARAADHARMHLFESYISGDLPVAVPELDKNEKAAIANLAAQGLEQYALRVASTLPSPDCPPVDPKDKESETRARKRKRFILGAWEANDMAEVLCLRAESLLAHGEAPVTVVPDPATGMPRWEWRSPRGTFPGARRTPLDIVPDDCIFTSAQTWGWVQRHAPDAQYLKRPKDCDDDTSVTIIEYIDADCLVGLATFGNVPDWNTTGFMPEVRVWGMENRAHTPLAFVPGWSTLVGRRGRFTDTIGAHQMRAKLLAIAYLTARKGAMPDPWIEANQTGIEPEIISYPNPQTGEPGVVKGGHITFDAPQPGFMTSPMLSILEREIRAVGVPADFTGESASAVRTGRRGDSILSNTVDFPTQRGQRLLARSVGLESRAAIHIVKSWTPAKKSFYVNWKGATGWVDYDPKVDFDSDQVNVSYALAGSDLNNDLQRNSAKIAQRLISRRTYRENDPEIRDAEEEHDREIAERLEDSFLTAVDLKIQDPQSRWGPREIAKLRKLILSDRMEAEEAVASIEDDMEEAQAAEAPTPDALPGAPGAPIPEPPEALANLSQTKQMLGGLLGQVA